MTDASGAARGELLRASEQSELNDLRARLRDAEEALDGIRSGEVDAVVVKGPLGQQIYTIANADRTYRLLIEQMKEGAVTILNTGLIVYCNNAFAALLGAPLGGEFEIIRKPFTQAELAAAFSKVTVGRANAMGQIRLRGAGP